MFFREYCYAHRRTVRFVHLLYEYSECLCVSVRIRHRFWKPFYCPLRLQCGHCTCCFSDGRSAFCYYFKLIILCKHTNLTCFLIFYSRLFFSLFLFSSTILRTMYSKLYSVFENAYCFQAMLMGSALSVNNIALS